MSLVKLAYRLKAHLIMEDAVFLPDLLEQRLEVTSEQLTEAMDQLVSAGYAYRERTKAGLEIRPSDLSMPNPYDEDEEPPCTWDPCYSRSRFIWVCKQIGWSWRSIATKLGTHEATIRAWANGRSQIPDNVGQWLEDLLYAWRGLEQPQDWKASEEHRRQCLDRMARREAAAA